MNVKVVKWCLKMWNEHNLMNIYHKQCEIMQKIQWNSSNGQNHWFPVEMVHNGTNYANANSLFSVAKYFLRYPGYAIWKLMSGRFWKRDGFLCYNFFKLELLLFKVWSNLKKCDSESGGVTKINTQSILRFLRSSWEKFLNGI